MTVTVVRTALPDVLIIAPRVFADERGEFFESFNARDFAAATGINRTFVQDNHSVSARGVLRGLHYQIQHPQGKLVRVTRGEVFDVAVDLRRSSPTFGQCATTVISAENKRQVWIPEGLAHGYLVMSDVAEFLYRTTDYWHPEFERTLAWNDEALGISWPLDGTPLLSVKDVAGRPLSVVETFE